MLVRYMTILLISALAYCASMGTVSAASFGVGDFVTYSQDANSPLPYSIESNFLGGSHGS
jgi:hypothetical protein